MKMMLRKTLALVLAVLMVVGMFPLQQAQEAFAAGTSQAMTVYFENNWNWSDVKIHYWNASGNNGWPGTAMTKSGKSDGGKDIYSFTIPAGTTGIIFNGLKDDGSGSRDQSPNIENSAIQTGVCYYMDWNNGNQVKTYTYSTTTTYNVTYSGTNLTCIGESKVTAGTAYSCTLTAASGYKLPDSITVTVGGTALSSGYSYDKSTGKVTVEAAKVTGNINIKADAVKEQVDNPTTVTLYLNPNIWTVDGGPYKIHYWGGSSSGDVEMTEVGGGIYSAEVPADATMVLFHRNNYGHKTNDLNMPSDGSNLYTITGWDTGNKVCPGEWSVYGGGSGEEKDTYYVNTDIVDYLNDTRVNFGNVNGYSSDNQGNVMSRDGRYSVYGYLNRVISDNAVDKNGNSVYSYPLYFGDLLFESVRYGWNGSSQSALKNWHTGANVALYAYGNYNSVVQGLVGDKLNKDGQLVDPKTGATLFYFDKTSIESWTTSATGGNRLMAYYSNLQFPFKTSYDASTGVTTYSYDSAKDQGVFIDYDKYDSSATSNPMYVGSSALDMNGHKGFFPLSKPNDSGDNANYSFGTKFTINFTVSDDGVIRTADNKETPVQFKFTGDDDVWVFIDGYLVLDMGGAHTMATGTINFKDLVAVVNQAAQVGDPRTGTSSTSGGENRDSLEVKQDVTTNFPEELAKVFRNEYATGMSQVHTLTMFYMERGGIESNMSIEFSMSPIPTGLTVSKDIEGVNPGLNDDVQSDDEFSFIVEAEKDGENVVFDGYELTDHNSNTTQGTITNDNTINGVRGDKYAHSFTNGNHSAFSAGTSFKITEVKSTPWNYSSTRWVVYEYSNGYTELKSGSGFEAAFDTLANSSGNYAVNFINKIDSGTLVITKKYADTLIDTSGMEFTFNVYLDVKGTADENDLQPGLTYDLYNGDTLVSSNVISEDGTIKLKAGQTAKISGIPVGTSYKIVEVDDSSLWETVNDGPVSNGTVTGTIGNADIDSEVAYTFTNKTTTRTLNKVIYVEAGVKTAYAIFDGSKSIAVKSVFNMDEGVKVDIDNGKAMVNAEEANKRYTFYYAGIDADGVYVSGSVTVYSYAATIRNYVFDFGLIADLDDGDSGLFQGGCFDNTYASGESAILKTLVGNGNTQTTIAALMNGAIGADNHYQFDVTFNPVAIMDKIETYSYTVQITAQGQTFDANNPETGCIVTGTIRVMPANTVYYEEYFGSNAIVFKDGVTFEGYDKELMQDASGSGAYGYDSAYNGYYQDSNGSYATLNHLDYAYFTFSGTGFDLISQTNATSAGLAVYVFEGEHSDAKLKYVTDLDDTGVTPEDMVFVHTYYTNGSLYQVPVIDVRLEEYGTYTVYIQCLQTNNGGVRCESAVLDGIRIYNPLQDTQYYASGEQNVIFSELRQMLNSNHNDTIDSGDALHLAGFANDELFVGTGKQSVVAQALIENPALLETTTSADLMAIFQQGPNNEMYLPKSMGVMLTYSVTGPAWTLQLGAKAVSATGEAKSISIYIREQGSEALNKVAEITLSTSTDMFYDLSTLLGDYSENGKTYELFIISDSAAGNNEFVSLTSIKHAGLKFGTAN